MRRFTISAVVFFLYLLLIATSFTYGATMHLELNAYSSEGYIELNGGVVSRGGYGFSPASYVMPDYASKPLGYYFNDEVSVVYDIPLGLYAQSATLFVRTAFPFANTNAYALLDVSGDGTNWHSVPTNETVDIGAYIHDATDIHVRGRLWAEYGPISCQFLYTAPGQSPGFVLDASGFAFPAPEPSTLHLLIMGGICLTIIGYKRVTRKF
jgi:hypothetical protein